ncbi:MAG: DNA-3-methyladenine glycosylase [Saprospiraceae bacterium]
MSYNLSPAEKDTVRATLSKDAVLRPLIDELPFPEERIQLREMYPSLLRSIVGQQVSTKAAAAIYKRFLMVFGLDGEDDTVAPSPEVLAKAVPDELRAAGLSWSKVSYVIAMAEYFVAHPNAETDLREMDDEAVIAELVSIKGVGRWTAEMMLIFAMGRTDLLPLDDLAIYQTIMELYDLSPDAKKKDLKKQMTEIAEAWRPYRSIVCLYLYSWRHVEKQKGGATL